MNQETWPVHNFAAATVQSMAKWERKAADLYPTPPAGTVAILQQLGLAPGSVIVEPACGDGDVSRVLHQLGHNVISSDLRYTGYGTGGLDFTGPAYGQFLLGKPQVDAVITNPPFVLAEQFIVRALQFAPLVVMLLKSNYWNTKSRLRLWDKHTPTGRFPVTWRLAFLEAERGKSPLMDCDWIVWKRGDPPLRDRPLARPSGLLVPDISKKPLLVRLRGLSDAFERLEANISALR